MWRCGAPLRRSTPGTSDPPVPPTRPPHPNLATTTRQATRRCRHPYRLAMAAATRHRSPQYDRGPIPAGADRKVEQPHFCRLRRDPPRAVSGRCRTTPRRPRRRGSLVAHPRSVTAKAEPGPGNPQRRSSDETYNHETIRPAAIQAPLGAASHVRPEPLKPRRIPTPEESLGRVCPKPHYSVSSGPLRSAGQGASSVRPGAAPPLVVDLCPARARVAGDPEHVMG
jgi:hypothetical protein